MSRSAIRWTLVLIATVWIPFGFADEVAIVDEPAPPTVNRRDGVGADVTHAHLPGRIVSWVAADGPGEAGGIYMLVGPPPPPEDEEDERDNEPCPEMPRADLWHLTPGTPAAEPVLQRLDVEIPIDAYRLRAMDLDGDGTTSLLVQRTGEILELVPTQTPPDGYALETRLADPELRAGATAESPGDGAWIAATGIGTARIFRSGGGGIAPVATVELPIRANGWAGGVHVHSPVARWIDTDSRQETFLVTDAETVGRQRFRAFVIRPEADDEDARIEECWARLPEPEVPLRYIPRTLDGAPVMLAITMPVGQVNMFGEVLVRLFPLEPDRSRTGHLPLAAFKSRVNLIQLESLTPEFRDVNGDGASDLILHHREGFDGEGLELDVYLREPDGGGFSKKPRTTGFKVKSGEIRDVAYGRDLDGDELPDLLVLAQDEALVYPGVTKGKKLVSSDPVRRVDLPGIVDEDNDGVTISVSSGGVQTASVIGSAARLRIVDRKGESRPDVVIARSSRLTVVRFK